MKYQALIILAISVLSLSAAAKDLPPIGAGMNLAESGVDRQDELQRIFDRAAQTGQRVVLPAETFRHSGLLYIRGIDVSGAGPKTVIEGTTRDNAAIVLTGKGAKLSNVKLTFNSTTRSGTDNSAEVLVKDADGFEVSRLVIDGGDSGGILMMNAHNGVVQYNDIRNTLADSIHMTGGTSDIVVHDNMTYNSGDDGVAVVSYERNGTLVHNIEAYNNSVIDNKFARGMSVVGGENVFYHDNFIRCVGPWAGLYVSSEKVFKTYGAKNVRMANNIVKGCGKKNSGYDAVTVSTNYNDNDHIEFMGNVLVDSPAMGFHVIGKGNNDIIIRDNVIIRPKDDPIYAEPDVPPLQQSGNTVVKGD